MTAAETLDTIGLLCPLPVLKARKRLQSMHSGAVLRVLASDPAALVDMPHFCHQNGHSLLDTQDLPEGGQAYYIQKG